jgi:hypothetical protein
VLPPPLFSFSAALSRRRMQRESCQVPPDAEDVSLI